MSRTVTSAGVPWPDGHVSDSVFFPVIFGTLLTGIALSMTFTYIARYGKRGADKWPYWALVAMVMTSLLVKTALDIEFLRDTIMNDQSTQLGGELTASLSVTYSTIAVPQVWLVWRVHMVSQHRWMITGVGALLVTASFASFVGLLVTKRPEWQIFLEPHFRDWWIAYSTTTALADVYLSSAFIWSIVRLRKRTGDPRFRAFLGIMLGVALSSFSLTAIMSVCFWIAVLVSIENPIFSSFYSLCAPLNCISVLYTLNSRSRTALQDKGQASAYAINVSSNRHGNDLVPSSPSSSVSQTASANSNMPWCKVTVEKEIRVDEEAEQVEMPSGEEAPRSTSPLRQIPRKEPPRFEEV